MLEGGCTLNIEKVLLGLKPQVFSAAAKFLMAEATTRSTGRSKSCWREFRRRRLEAQSTSNQHLCQPKFKRIIPPSFISSGRRARPRGRGGAGKGDGVEGVRGRVV